MYIADGHAKVFSDAGTAASFSCSQLLNASNIEVDAVTQTGSNLSVRCSYDNVNGDPGFGSSLPATWGPGCPQGILTAGDVCEGVDGGKRRTCPDPQSGNPISTLTGVKTQREIDLIDAARGGMEFARYYSSAGFRQSHAAMGSQWRHGFESRLVFGFSPDIAGEPIRFQNCSASFDIINGVWSGSGTCDSRVIQLSTVAAINTVKVHHPDGGTTYFELNGQQWAADTDVDSHFEEIQLNGEGVGWQFTRKSGVVEQFNTQGQLTRRTDDNKNTLSFIYSLASSSGGDDDPSTLDSVVDQRGRMLSFSYDAGMMVGMLDYNGLQYRYGYEQIGESPERWRLTYASLPGAVNSAQGDNPFGENSPYRTYHYEDATFPTGLTGITDEQGIRYVSWAYDNSRRAILSKREPPSDTTGNQQVTIDFSDVNHPVAPQVRQTNALGLTTAYYFGVVNHSRKIIRVARQAHINANEAAIGCAAADQFYSYDSNGYLDLVTDWVGNVVDYDHDSAGREVKKTEGLRWQNDAVGSQLVATDATRVTSQQWHPTFAKVTRQAAAELVTDFRYDCASAQLLERVVRPAASAPVYAAPNCGGAVEE